MSDNTSTVQRSVEVTKELVESVKALRADNESLRAQLTTDDPQFDSTDAAHPAWWRGHNHAATMICQKIQDILDGKDDGAGVCNEPFESVRRRVLEVRAQLAEAVRENKAVAVVLWPNEGETLADAAQRQMSLRGQIREQRDEAVAIIDSLMAGVDDYWRTIPEGVTVPERVAALRQQLQSGEGA